MNTNECVIILISYTSFSNSVIHCISLKRGPEDSPFEGGVFVTELIFPTDYPLSPPKMKFVSEMFHPNGTKSSDPIGWILIREHPLFPSLTPTSYRLLGVVF